MKQEASKRFNRNILSLLIVEVLLQILFDEVPGNNL